MATITLTVESIAERIAADEATTAKFINERAGKLFYASYSRGTYGRIMLPLIKKHYPRLDLNGASTSVALAITRKLEENGYNWIPADGTIKFVKAVA